MKASSAIVIAALAALGVASGTGCARHSPQDGAARLFAWTAQARAHLEAGRCSEATRLLARVANARQTADAYANLGLAQLGAQDLEAAAGSWMRALEIEPHHVDALYQLARLQWAQARSVPRAASSTSVAAEERALGLLDRAIARDPANAAVLRLLECVHRDLGDSSATQAARRESERFDPERAGRTAAAFGLGCIELPIATRAIGTRKAPQFVMQSHPLVARGTTGLAASDVGTGSGAEVAVLGTQATLSCGAPVDSSVGVVLRQRDLGATIAGARWATLDADGDADLVFWSVEFGTENKAQTTFWLLPAGQGRSARALAHLPGLVTDVDLSDVDRDGDIDVVAAMRGLQGLRVLRNAGTGELVVEPDAVAPRPELVQVEGADLDGDGWRDLVTLDVFGRAEVWGARGAGRFVALGMPLEVRRARVLALADLDHDGNHDLLLGGDDGLWAYANRGAMRFEPRAAYRDARSGWSAEVSRPVPVIGILVADIDNDGFPDILTQHALPPAPDLLAVNARGPRSAEDSAPRVLAALDAPHVNTPTRIAVWRNEGSFIFADVTIVAGLDAVSWRAAALCAADFDNDGDVDLAAIASDSVLCMVRNQLTGANRLLVLELADTKRPAASHAARVEVLAAGHVLVNESIGPTARFGVGALNTADVVRVVWSDGMIQSALDVALSCDRPLRIVRAN